MHSLRNFWKDEAGSVVSAELVTIGAVVAFGAVTGMQTVSNAVNDELKDVTKAIRSLDQSYSYRGFRGCNSMTAGSAFVDTSIDLVGDRPVNLSAGEFQGELDGQQSLELEPEEPVTSADAKLDE
jgi:Flp pilus assembly pilin Flp